MATRYWPEFNISWTPPPWERLNFTRDCTLTGEFLGQYFSKPTSPPSISVVIQYFTSAMPLDVDISVGQIVEWYYVVERQIMDLQNVEVRQHVLITPRKICEAEFCTRFEWQGNADISGIGIFVSHYAAAILATFYLVIILLDSNAGKRTKNQHIQAAPALSLSSKRFTRVKGAVHGSLLTFLDTAFLFTFALEIATLFILATPAAGFADEVNSIDGQIAVVTSTFCMFMTSVLCQAAGIQGPRSKLRHSTFCIITLLNGVAFILLLRPTPSYLDSAWVRYCGKTSDLGPDLTNGSETVVRIGLFIACFPCLPALNLVTQRQSRSRRFSTRKIALILAVLFCVIMWALLLLTTVFRQRIIAATGLSNQERKFSFGQILALATWTPVLVDFMYSYLYGVENGIRGRLPYLWKVTFDKGENITSPNSVQLEPMTSGNASRTNTLAAEIAMATPPSVLLESTVHRGLEPSAAPINNTASDPGPSVDLGIARNSGSRLEDAEQNPSGISHRIRLQTAIESCSSAAEQQTRRD